MLIDTHCHLHDQEFFTPEEAKKALQKARENKVEKIICIGTSLKDSRAAQKFASTHENVYWTLGIHPESASQAQNKFLEDLPRIACWRFEESEPREDGSERTGLQETYSSAPAPIAIGEIGLDYHYSPEKRDAQIKLLESLLQLAKEKNLPVSFHIREAFEDFFSIIKNFPKIRGVVHSFTDNKKTLKRILNETDFYIGVNGLATYSTLPTPPLDRILLETDAPFLAPTPFKGTKNEPAHIKEIAEWLAAKLNLPFETIAEATTENAENLFHITK